MRCISFSLPIVWKKATPIFFSTGSISPMGNTAPAICSSRLIGNRLTTLTLSPDPRQLVTLSYVTEGSIPKMRTVVVCIGTRISALEVGSALSFLMKADNWPSARTVSFKSISFLAVNLAPFTVIQKYFSVQSLPYHFPNHHRIFLWLPARQHLNPTGTCRAVPCRTTSVQLTD